MTVDELLSSMSAREFADWIAFARVEPFGEDRADLRAGIVASVIANANRDRKKRAKPYEPVDFMPQFEKPTVEDKVRKVLGGMVKG